MSENVRLTREKEIAVVTIDNPPVNALGPGIPEAIQAAIESAAADADVSAIVVMGAGRTFIAGADIREFGKIVRGEKPGRTLLPFLTAIEACAKPVVMAIHGQAFGGGLETAMAGHYRVIAAGAQVGQPEVKLGIIPGASGTQRLPRLAGFAKAVEMCAFGEPIGAEEALAAGIVDRIVEGDLLAGAIAFAREIAGKEAPRTSRRESKLRDHDPAIFAAARAQAQKTKRGQTAPLAAIEAVENATRLSFEEGCAREARAVSRMPLLDAVQGADPRILRGARGFEDPGHRGGHAGAGDPARGGDRRGHDGRRHHDELRQCRNSGDRQGDEPGGAGPRDGDHPQELRGQREEGQAGAGRDGRAHGADHAAIELRGL